MNEGDRKLFRELLDRQRVLSLSLLVDGRPIAGLLPFAALPDYSAVLVHASGLARHSKGLLPDAAFGAVIHRPDRLEADPLRLPRLIIDGSVTPLARGSADYEAGKRIFLRKFPQSEMTFSLGDFNLYQLRLSAGRIIAGFAQARRWTAEDLNKLVDGD